MIYAIGDIHGEYNLLVDLYQKILYDVQSSNDKENTIVFLGDYTDRGKHTLKVFDFLMKLEDTQNIKHIFLTGNHEVMFVNAVTAGPFNDDEIMFWLRNGGEAVLKEANVEWDLFIETLDCKEIVEWICQKTRLYYETEDYVFVHGGLDIKRDICSQTPDYVLWSRHMNEGHYANYKKMVIHGHTSYSKPFIDINRICVDTSYHHKKKILTSVVLQNRKIGKPKFLKSERPL